MSNVSELAFGTDTARTRRTNPVASHEAADQSAESRDLILGLVRRLLLDAGEKGLTDRELTRRFFTRFEVGCDLDSPRKRRSDLTKLGEVLTDGSRRRTGTARVAQTVWRHHMFVEPHPRKKATP